MTTPPAPIADVLAKALETASLPTQEESDECDAAFALYAKNLKGLTCNRDDHRAGWFGQKALAAYLVGNGRETEHLRAEQTTSVMPLIGPLLDAWEGMSNDFKSEVLEEAPDLGDMLTSIGRAMDGQPSTAPAASEGQPLPCVLDISLDEEQADFLRQTIGTEDEAMPIRLMFGDGHSGRGLYVSAAEYPDEGSSLVVPAPAAQAEQIPTESFEANGDRIFIAPPGQAGVQPVAWIWKYANGEEEVVFVDAATIDWDPNTMDCPSKVTPLYIAPPGATALRPLGEAARDVLAERERQVSAEGWAPSHDDQHCDRSLVKAAVCYALPRYQYLLDGETTPIGWPWSPGWWKPATERRNLVKAGALILAEIERLDRITPTGADGAKD